MHDNIKHKRVSFTHQVYSDRLQIYRASSNGDKNTFGEDVRKGLLAENKFLLPKYFYDSKGSFYFEKICETPEYYLTRTEAAILKKYCGEIAEINADKNVLVELGSGASIKTKFIINAFLLNYGNLEYIPIDVSDILIESSQKLTDVFEKLSITGIHSEYEDGLTLLNEINRKPKLIIFLGSSIGNFSSDDAVSFLKFISGSMNADDRLFVGFDLKKDESILNAAYNDKEGYTAKFNLNLLTRINNELDADFNLENFRHVAFFNDSQNRVEMHIESLQDQDVFIRAIETKIHFKKGERIHTENSYKFTDEMINDLAQRSGLIADGFWKDEKEYFSLCLMRKTI